MPVLHLHAVGDFIGGWEALLFGLSAFRHGEIAVVLESLRSRERPAVVNNPVRWERGSYFGNEKRSVAFERNR